MQEGRIIIRGGNSLSGEVRVSGAKNAALPILAASLLFPQRRIILKNIPKLTDVKNMVEVLNILGGEVEELEGGRVLSISTSNLNSYSPPWDKMKKMRATFLVLAPLLIRFGVAKVPLPGGCCIGTRPVNLHIEGLEKMGAEVTKEEGFVYVKAKKLKGTDIILGYPSVGATEALLMAGVGAEGETSIGNAALEPEVGELINFLNKAGCIIEGKDTSRIKIVGTPHVLKYSFSTLEYEIIPDRIEAATYLLVGAMTKSNIKVSPIIKEHLTEVINKLNACSFRIRMDTSKKMYVIPQNNHKIQPISISTGPYPGFPTDMQAQFMSLLSLADGTSIIRETVFDKRFLHVPELIRLGADIEIHSDTAIIRGPVRLTGAPVKATDLRASAALILAGLVAEGTTIIEKTHHLDRGYEDMVGKLKNLGADIERE